MRIERNSSDAGRPKFRKTRSPRGDRLRVSRCETKIKTKINKIEKKTVWMGRGRAKGRGNGLAKSPWPRAPRWTTRRAINIVRLDLRCRRCWGWLRTEGATINHSMLIKPAAK